MAHEPADQLFLRWWNSIIVEERPIHSVPSAWLWFVVSMRLQNKLSPFDPA